MSTFFRFGKRDNNPTHRKFIDEFLKIINDSAPYLAEKSVRQIKTES